MKTTGVREVRLSLSKLLRSVKRGEEIVITERKVPVARLVPYRAVARPPLPSRAALREKYAHLKLDLSRAILEERDER
jgi:prevent-host-death family protein